MVCCASTITRGVPFLVVLIGRPITKFSSQRIRFPLICKLKTTNWESTNLCSSLRGIHESRYFYRTSHLLTWTFCNEKYICFIKLLHLYTLNHLFDGSMTDDWMMADGPITVEPSDRRLLKFQNFVWNESNKVSYQMYYKNKMIDQHFVFH